MVFNRASGGDGPSVDASIGMLLDHNESLSKVRFRHNHDKKLLSIVL